MNESPRKRAEELEIEKEELESEHASLLEELKNVAFGDFEEQEKAELRAEELQLALNELYSEQSLLWEEMENA